MVGGPPSFRSSLFPSGSVFAAPARRRIVPAAAVVSPAAGSLTALSRAVVLRPASRALLGRLIFGAALASPFPLR